MQINDNTSFNDLYVEYTLDIKRLQDMLDSAQDDKTRTSVRKSIRNCKRMLERLVSDAKAAGVTQLGQ